MAKAFVDTSSDNTAIEFSMGYKRKCSGIVEVGGSGDDPTIQLQAKFLDRNNVESGWVPIHDKAAVTITSSDPLMFWVRVPIWSLKLVVANNGSSRTITARVFPYSD